MCFVLLYTLQTLVIPNTYRALYFCEIQHSLSESGPLSQSVERGADNVKVVSSTLTRTIISVFRQ